MKPLEEVGGRALQRDRPEAFVQGVGERGRSPLGDLGAADAGHDARHAVAVNPGAGQRGYSHHVDPFRERRERERHVELTGLPAGTPTSPRCSVSKPSRAKVTAQVPAASTSSYSPAASVVVVAVVAAARRSATSVATAVTATPTSGSPPAIRDQAAERAVLRHAGRRARPSRADRAPFQRLSVVGLAGLAFAAAELVGGNGFIAAFVAG